MRGEKKVKATEEIGKEKGVRMEKRRGRNGSTEGPDPSIYVID